MRLRGLSQTARALECEATIGALLCRNSQGSTWGQGGYDRMPYEYVLKRVALDFRSLLKMEYVDTYQFFE